MSLIKSSVLSMLALAALGVTRLVHLSLIAKATDPATVALVGTLIGLATAAGLFLPGGLASAMSRFVPHQLGRADVAAAHAARRLLTRAGYLTALILGALVGAGAWLFRGELTGLTRADALAAGALTAAFSLYSISKATLYGYHRVARYAALELAGSVVAIGSTVLVLAAGWHSYLLPLTLGYAVLIIGTQLSLGGVVRPAARAAVPAAQRREIAGYAGWASLGGFASAGLLQLLPALAGFFTTGTQVAYVVAAIGLTAPLYFLPRALGLALFPSMAHSHGAGDHACVRWQADVSTRGLIALLAPCFAAGIFLAGPALVLFGNPQYAEGAVVLQLLLAATYFSVIQVAAVNSLSSGDTRDVRIPVLSALTGLAVGCIALIPLGSWLGGPGVALAYLCAAVTAAAGPLATVWRRFRMPWRAPLFKAAGVVLSALVFSQLIAGRGWTTDLTAAAAGGGLAVLLLHGDLRAVLRLGRQPAAHLDDRAAEATS